MPIPSVLDSRVLYSAGPSEGQIDRNAIIENLSFDPMSEVIIISNDNLSVLAVTGIIGADDDSYGHIFKIYVFRRQPGQDGYEAAGQPIIGDKVNQSSDFEDDARADISLSGDGRRLAVGVQYRAERANSLPPRAVVKVFEHDFVDLSVSWTELATPIYDGDGGGGGLEQGLRVSLDAEGKKLAVGEMYYDDDFSGTENVGRVVVYDVDTKQQIGNDMHGTSANDNAGSSVMISRDGTCVIYGVSKGDSIAGVVDSGLAFVYCFSGTSWIKRGSQLEGENSEDEFGCSVAISSDAEYVAVGALSNDGFNGEKINAGHVRVYSYDGSAYTQFGPDIDGVKGEDQWGYYQVGDGSGTSIALSDKSEDGSIKLLIGSPNNQDEGYYVGHFRIFQWNDNGSTQWEQIASTVSGENEYAGVGDSVAMDSSGSLIAVAESSLNQNDFRAVVYEQSEKGWCDKDDLGDIGKKFQIRKENSYCLTAKRKAYGLGTSKLVLRPCKSYPTEADNLQTWKQDRAGQIKLAGSVDGYCITSWNMGLGLDSCDLPCVDEIDSRKRFSLINLPGRISQTKNNRQFIAGQIDPTRRFSQLMLFKLGVINSSTKNWEVHLME